MKTIARLDKVGRIVLPKAVRDRLRLAPGDAISIEVTDDEATLRHAASESALTRESGVRVFGTGKPMPHDEARDLLRSVRVERLADLSGSRLPDGQARPVQRLAMAAPVASP